MTTDDIANELDISEIYARQLCRKGRIKAQKLNTGVWVTTREALDDFKATRRKPGRPYKEDS